MIKHVCRILCFILFFNFYVMNFGIEVKKVQATTAQSTENNILDISSGRDINFEIRADNKYVIFDFNSFLSANDKVEQFTLKKEGKPITSQVVDANTKKAWKAKFLPLNGEKYSIEAVINIGGQNRKALFNFVYNDYDMGNEPELKFNKNDFEITFDQKWLDLFNDDEPIQIYAGNSYGNTLFTEVTVKAKELKANSRKQIFKDVKKNFRNNAGYWFKARVRGREYVWKLYTQNRNNDLTVQVMPVELKKIDYKDNSNNVDYEVAFKDPKGGSKLSIVDSDKFRRVSGKYATTIDASKKVAKITDESLSLNTDHTVRLEKGSDAIEGKFGLCIFYKFEKLNAKVKVIEVENKVSVTMDSSMKPFFNKNDASNKLYVYELNDNFTKGTKVCEKLSGVSDNEANEMNIISGVKFSTNKSYLVEFTNGTSTVTMPFIYTTFPTNNKNVEYTSAKVTWEYPSGYTPVDGDTVDIFLRDAGQNESFSAKAKVTLIHGTQRKDRVDFANTKEAVVEGIAPSTNYEARVVLRDNRGGSVAGHTSFNTKVFALKKYIDVQNCDYDTSSYWHVARHRSRNITVVWDFDPADMPFSNGDKVEIWIKPNGSFEFSGYPRDEKYGNPIFTRTHGGDVNLNNIKSGNIVIPSWLDHYHVDVIYTIGGKRIITPKPDNIQGESGYNRKTVQVKVNSPNINVSDIKQTTAKLTWEYDRGFIPSNDEIVRYTPELGHVIKAHIKKVSSISDISKNFDDNNSKQLFHFKHGEDGVNIGEKKEFVIKDLEPGQFYRIQLTHILQMPGFDNNYRSVSEYYNFQTGAFQITDLKAVQESQKPVVDLSWNTEGEITFAEGDKINIYLKEGSTSEYSDTPTRSFTSNADGIFDGNIASNSVTRTESETLTPSEGEYKVKLDIPKYNTPYNIKVEYVIKGKKITEFIQAEVNGEISLKVSEINPGNGSNGTVKVNWKYPEGYEQNKDLRKDNVRLSLMQKESEESEEVENIVLSKSSFEVTEKEYTIEGLKENKYYDLTATFVNDKDDVYSVTTSFKATSELQVVSLIASDVKAKTATISWDYFPVNKELSSDNSQIGLYIKDITSKNRSVQYTTLMEVTHNTSGTKEIPTEIDVSKISKNNNEKFNVEKFKKFKSIKLIGLSPNKEYSLYVQYKNMGSSHNETKNKEIKFKTKVNTFKASVFTSDQTKATFGWEYPPGYEIQEDDEVRIYIKEVIEGQKQRNEKGNGDYNDPLLVLKHEGETNLNEINRVDVSGLTPEKKYKAKIEFKMVGDEQPISTEVDISTKSFAIKSFEVDSYQEYDILVNWSVEPEGMKFNDADKVEIFVKLATETDYPTEPEYRIQGHGEKEGDPDIDSTFSDYVLAKTIGEEQKMKLVYTVGDRQYDKELTFTNTINPIKASVFSSDATRALIQVEAPDNYEFVSGDKLLIYAKDEFAEGNVEDEAFLVFEGIQSDSLSIPDDMRLIELSYLLPEATYEVLVKLDLQDGKADPAKLEFKTGAFNVTDLKLESIKHNSNIISWNYGDKEIDFYKDESKYEHTDKLIIAHKESSLGPIAEDLASIKQLNHKEILGPDIRSVKDFNVEVEDPSKDYEVIVFYQLGGLDYIKKFKTSNLYASSNEEAVKNDTASINWKYPTNVQLDDAAKTEIFIRKKNDDEYPSAPSNSSTGTGTTSYTFSGLEGETEYVAKVQVTKEGLSIDPVEVNFTTKAAPAKDVVIEQVEDTIQGTEAEFSIPASDVPINKDGEIKLSMGDEKYQGFTVKLNEDATSFIIEPTIPKKKYENIEVQLPLEDGTVMTITIKEFTTEPENITQDWLSNAYWFAFERFPDEEGYNYWYEHRMLTKKLNGEYFLKNLMFAEDEFTNRNLADKDLIAALYQIVVNREFDEEGLNFWIGIYNENLKNAQGNKKLAQETLVDRMVHEPEFGKLCDKAGIFWRQSDQDAAGVVA